ncbi:MAG TPA: hypothetical protein VGE69_06960, partial [Pseudomonadales bacterium]
EEANQAKVEDDEPKSHEPLPPEKDPELYEAAPSTVAAATGGIVSEAHTPATDVDADFEEDPVIAGDDAIGSITADEVSDNAERIRARAGRN